MSESENTLISELKALGYEAPNMEYLSTAARVHRREVPLSLEHIHPAARDLTQRFDNLLAERLGIESVTVPVGSSMVNWMVISALNGDYYSGAYPTDVDVFGVINSQSGKGQLDTHAEEIRDLQVGLKGDTGIVFCNVNALPQNALRINPIDYSDLLNPNVYYSPNPFLEWVLASDYQHASIYEELYGNTHQNPVFHNLKTKYLEGLALVAPEIEKYDPNMQEILNRAFGMDQTTSIAEGLVQIALTKTVLVAPVKRKHIMRTIPSAVMESLNKEGDAAVKRHVDAVLGVLNRFGMSTEA